MERECPFCRRIISIDDNYCPYCGYELKSTSASPREIDIVEETPTPLETRSEEVSKRKVKSKKSSEIENQEIEPAIPEELIEQYYIRIKIKQYDEKLKDYREKIDNFLSNLNEQELAEIQDEIPKLEESIAKLKQKKKELLAQKQTLPQEGLLDERNKLKKQISNLHNKFHLKEIEPHVYEKLKKEYKSKLDQIDHKLKEEFHFEDNWKKMLQKDINKHKEKLEILEVRFKVGELSQEDFENEKMKINEKIEKLSFLSSELKM